MTGPDESKIDADFPPPAVSAALEADRLLEAFAASDMDVLRVIEKPSDEAIAALLMVTTLAIKALAEDRPGMSEESIRLKFRRLVAEMLANPAPLED